MYVLTTMSLKQILQDRIYDSFPHHVNHTTYAGMCRGCKDIERFIDANPDDPRWEWEWVSSNPYISSAFIERYIHKLRHFARLSAHPNLTWDIVRAHPDKPWEFYHLTIHPNISWDIIRENPTLPWYYGLLGMSPKITWDIIVSSPDIPWDYQYVSQNPHITRAIVEAYPEKPWNWIQLLQAHPDFFDPTPEEEVAFYREVFAARRIWRAWFRANTNPAFAVCRRRLLREYIDCNKSTKRNKNA